MRLGEEAERAQVAERCQGVGRRRRTTVTRTLDAYGELRFRAKGEKLVAQLSRYSVDQVLYGGLLEALGYTSYRRAFQRVAEAVPYQRARYLLGEGDEDGRRRLERALMEATRGGSYQGRSGRLARVRLAGASYVLQRTQGEGLVPTLGRCLTARDVPTAVRLLSSLLTVRSERQTFISPARAKEILVNAVLPFLALAPYQSERWQRRSWAVFRRYPLVEDYGVTRRLAARLFGAEEPAEVATAQRQQGLLHLDKNYCRAGRCATCPMGQANALT